MTATEVVARGTAALVMLIATAAAEAVMAAAANSNNSGGSNNSIGVSSIKLVVLAADVATRWRAIRNNAAVEDQHLWQRRRPEKLRQHSFVGVLVFELKTHVCTSNDS